MSEVFVTYPELLGYGIRYSRVHLHTMMDAGLFPPAVKLSANRIAWRASDLRCFADSRPLAGQPLPVLWPTRTREKTTVTPVRGAKPVGRPRGSKVIRADDGRRRLVRPEELAINAMPDKAKNCAPARE